MAKKGARGRGLSRLKKKVRKEQQIRKAKAAGFKVPEGSSATEVARAFNRSQPPVGSKETSIADIFGDVVDKIRAQMAEKQEDGVVKRPGHSAAVDIKLEFKSLDLKRKGLIFKSEHKESSISLQLMTRILPEDEVSS